MLISFAGTGDAEPPASRPERHAQRASDSRGHGQCRHTRLIAPPSPCPGQRKDPLGFSSAATREPQKPNVEAPQRVAMYRL